MSLTTISKDQLQEEVFESLCSSSEFSIQDSCQDGPPKRACLECLYDKYCEIIQGHRDHHFAAQCHPINRSDFADLVGAFYDKVKDPLTGAWYFERLSLVSLNDDQTCLIHDHVE